jgi:structure-specific recognition protein 1
MGGPKAKGRKGGGAMDQLVEMRFYIPGTTTTKKTKEGGEDGEVSSNDEDAETEEHNAANLFYNMLADKAEIGAVAGDTFATFLDILHLTPRLVSKNDFFFFFFFLSLISLFLNWTNMLLTINRGRFDLDMYENSFRMRGKTYDYKILYDSVKKVMMLPKPDELHTLLVFGLDPPLRQGQTTYPFLVMQFRKDEEVQLELNMTE